MKIKAAVLEKMGAATPYEKSKPLAVQAVELDSPGDGEVLVKVAAAGLCHSDLSVIDGNRPRPTPMVLGHEAAGVVPGRCFLVHGGCTAMAVTSTIISAFLPLLNMPRSRVGHWSRLIASCRWMRRRYLAARC